MDAIKGLREADKDLKLDQGYLALAAILPCLLTNELITQSECIQIMEFYDKLRGDLDISRSKK